MLINKQLVGQGVICWRASMSLDELGFEVEDKTLLIDGDILIYKNCCVFDEDDDQSRRLISKYIDQKIDTLMQSANCNMYIMFITTDSNFRDDLVDDYKLNRDKKPRPVNLTWAKRWSVVNTNTHYTEKLEADDLLGTHQTEDTVIWSTDKDLRQIPGQHLDDATQKIVTITEDGCIRKLIKYKNAKKVTKYYFDGLLGLYFQMLTGDSVDYIVGCGKREMVLIASGKNKGTRKLKRVGVGPLKAYELLIKADNIKEAKLVIARQYFLEHGNSWKQHLETQANLLFMVRWHEDDIIKRWTFDDRDEYFDLGKGVILNDDEYKGVTS